MDFGRSFGDLQYIRRSGYLISSKKSDFLFCLSENLREEKKKSMGGGDISEASTSPNTVFRTSNIDFVAYLEFNERKKNFSNESRMRSPPPLSLSLKGICSILRSQCIWFYAKIQFPFLSENHEREREGTKQMLWESYFSLWNALSVSL